MGRIIGIDLGTSNCCVAVIEDGKPIVIPNKEGGLTTPSVVGFAEDGRCLVGAPAKRRAILHPDKTVYSIKRFMGEEFDNVKKEKNLSPFQLIRGDNNIPCVKIDERHYTPQEISAILLMNAKQSAERYLGEEVNEAVITVPAYFNDIQRQATKEAAEIAGLNARRIISEPTAALMAYGYNSGMGSQEIDFTVAVFHMGGGTFDVSSVSFGKGVYEVLSTDGNTHLGGDDFDRKIVNWLADDFKYEHGVDLRNDPMALQRLNEAAEKAKCELSESLETTINLPFITMRTDDPIHLNKKLTREHFEHMCADLLDSLEGPCRRAMLDYCWRPIALEKVILAGGATRMPAVQKKVKEIFGIEPSKQVNPDEAVAIGAAIQGSVLYGSIKDLLLLDVVPHSLGIETQGGIMTKLIEVKTTIPTKKSMRFSTVRDNQTEVEIHVLQGEKPLAKDNISLGRFVLTDLPLSPKGVPQIEVTFDIDANGILCVSAIDKNTGLSQYIRIEAKNGLSENEIISKKKNLESINF